MVTAIDEGIGEVVDALKARNLWENTLLVFSSGKMFNKDMRNVCKVSCFGCSIWVICTNVLKRR